MDATSRDRIRLALRILSAFSDPPVTITKLKWRRLKSSFQGDSIRSGLLARPECFEKVPSLSDGASLGKWAAGLITGLILGLTLLTLAAARAQREIIVDFTTAPVSAEDAHLLISCGDVPPASGGRCWLALATYPGIRAPVARPAPAPPWPAS